MQSTNIKFEILNLEVAQRYSVKCLSKTAFLAADTISADDLVSVFKINIDVRNCIGRQKRVRSAGINDQFVYDKDLSFVIYRN